MSKIKLGQRPKSFDKAVKFEMLEGGTETIVCTFKYRTRTEFGQFIDGLVSDAGVKVDATDEKFSMTDLMKKTAGSNAKYLLQVLDGWSLDIDLTLSNAEQLADELPAAAVAIMETYRVAVTEGRLGN